MRTDEIHRECASSDVFGAEFLPLPPSWRPVADPLSRLIRYGRLVALAVGAFLLPWCLVLWAALPATTTVRHWWLAWVGLDGGEAVLALATALLLARRDVRASLTATATAALLLCDAWFDICTSAPGLDHAMAIAEAVLAEVPLAVAAVWLAARLLAGARELASSAVPVAACGPLCRVDEDVRCLRQGLGQPAVEPVGMFAIFGRLASSHGPPATAVMSPRRRPRG